MPTTFNVISLGTAADMDTAEGNNVAENASALVGLTFGGVGDPLVNDFASFSPGTGGFGGGTSTRYDQDNSPAENFSIDGGPDQVFDSAARFNATLTYTDGSTVSISVAIFQDTVGNTYLAPEASQNSTQDALEAAPIRSITLDSLVTGTTSGLDGNRDAFQFVTCFTPGVRLQTPTGPVPVEQLCAGDLISTLDHGPRPIRWVGSCARVAVGKMAPVRIREGSLGEGLPQRDILVSRQHRMLVTSKIAERIFGTRQILVAAKDLLTIDGIEMVSDMAIVHYLHFLLDRHEILFAEGTPTESLLTGPMARDAIGVDALVRVENQFPDAVKDSSIPARVIARGKKLRHLLERHRKHKRPLIQYPVAQDSAESDAYQSVAI